MSSALNASANIGGDLYRLTEYLAKNGYDAAHGVLGGDWGYGCEVSNETFEMHPFWWGDCECGRSTAEMEWEGANPHAVGCYYVELQRREDAESDRPQDVAPKLAEEWGLPYQGCAVHCTCGRDERYDVWLREHPHVPTCPEVRPNFRHHASGLEVRWYKWIGRDMEVTPFEPSAQDWATIFDECVRAAG